MKILFIHTHYKEKGGEDSVLAAEIDLLSQKHEVDTLTFSNDDFDKKGALASLRDTFYNPTSYQKVKSKIKSFAPDIIHIHNIFYEASPSILYAIEKSRIPVVMTLHNYRLICSNALLLRENKICESCIDKVIPLQGVLNKCFKNSYFKTAALTSMVGVHKMLKTWNSKVDRYFVLSEFQKERLLNSSLKIDKDKLIVKPNFVEDQGQGDSNLRRNYFLFIGRLIQSKGIDLLIEAQKKYEFELEIIGDGELRSMVEQAASSSEKVIYHGFKEKDFIVEKLKGAKALVFPSIWYEGMPMTVLESFSTGTPAIVSDIENVKDLVQEGANGFHFRNGDSNSLAQILKYAAENLSASHYEKAYTTYQRLYCKERNMTLLEENYQELVRLRSEQAVAAAVSQ